MKPPNTKPTRSAELTPADVWADQTTEAAARAMVSWLKGSVHLSRPISSFRLDEMKTLASTAIHTWIIAASHRAPIEPDPAQRQKLKVLLS